MPREFQFQVTPEVAANETLLNQYVAKLFNVSPKEIQKTVVVKRSIDARQKAIKVNIKANVFLVAKDIRPGLLLPRLPVSLQLLLFADYCLAKPLLHL